MPYAEHKERMGEEGKRVKERDVYIASAVMVVII